MTDVVNKSGRISLGAAIKPSSPPKDGRPAVLKEKPGDAYAMAYKALSWSATDDLYLETHEVMAAYQSVLFVFAIQCLMIGLIFDLLN